MITGLGTDIVEIDRIRAVEDKNNRLSKRILSEDEARYYETLTSDSRKIEYLAGRYAVKEAYSKALGSGIGATISFKEIICLNDEMGKPYLQNDQAALVSISHTEHYATATVIIQTVKE